MNTKTNLIAGVLLCLPLSVYADTMVHGHPNRGTIEVDVLLCKFSDSPAVKSPYDQRSYYENMFFADNPFRASGTGSLKNYFHDISRVGSIAPEALTLTGSVHGWYTEPRTYAVGLNRGGDVNQDCIDAAKAGGHTPPVGSIIAVVLSPFSVSVQFPYSGQSQGGRCKTTETSGCQGWTLAPANISFATMAHELGHALDLTHSYSRQSGGDVEYGDNWDLMSNPQGTQWPAGLNGTNLDRMGWLRSDQIRTVGADGSTGGTFRLKPLYSVSPGLRVLRIPAEAGNPNHYYTVEYRTKTGWDSGISVNASTGGIVLIHETYGGSSYLLLSSGVPVQTMLLKTYALGWISATTDTVTGEAVIGVGLPSTLVTTAKSLLGQNACLVGYLWRSADSMDYVCVAPWVFNQTLNENLTASFNRSPTGGAYGPDTCLSGLVWREAYPGDHVCVAPWSRSQAADDNKHAAERVANP